MAVSVSVGETTKNTQQGLSWTGPLRFVVRFLLLHLFCRNRLNPLFVPCLSALILPDSKRLSQGFDLCSSIQRLCLHLYLFTATTTLPYIHTRPNQAIPNTNLTISFLHSREHICFVLPHTCFLHFRHAFLRVCQAVFGRPVFGRPWTSLVSFWYVWMARNHCRTWTMVVVAIAIDGREATSGALKARWLSVVF